MSLVTNESLQAQNNTDSITETINSWVEWTCNESNEPRTNGSRITRTKTEKADWDKQKKLIKFKLNLAEVMISESFLID